MGRPFFWRHLPVPAWTIDLELRAAGNSAGSLTPPSCTPQNNSVSLITRCLNLPHVTSQCNVARDWVRYAPFCFCCDSRGRKWGPQHHRFITGPPTPPTKRQNGGLLSYIARWYISSGAIVYYKTFALSVVSRRLLSAILWPPKVLFYRGKPYLSPCMHPVATLWLCDVFEWCSI